MRPVAWWGGLSRRRRTLFAVLVLVVAVGAVIGVLRAGSGSPAVLEDRPGDVLLVPGYGGSTGSLDVLAARIRARGRTAVVVQLAGNGTGDLQVQANVLNGYVNRALSSGSGRVTVIGYSAGGVVAWLWDTEYDGVAKTRNIITLGSPLHGTSLASLGEAFDPGLCPQGCEQLVPGSAMLTRLQQTPAGSRPPWLSLWTTDDQVVQPPDSARLPGAINVPLQAVCPGVSIQHSQLPSSPLVIGIVLRALDSTVRAVPAPSDCRSLTVSGSLSGALRSRPGPGCSLPTATRPPGTPLSSPQTGRAGRPSAAVAGNAKDRRHFPHRIGQCQELKAAPAGCPRVVRAGWS